MASLEEDAQDHWLAWAIEHEATVQELRDAIRTERDQGDGDGNDPGSGTGEETRLEVEEDSARASYEVRLDMDTGEGARVHMSPP